MRPGNGSNFLESKSKVYLKGLHIPRWDHPKNHVATAGLERVPEGFTYELPADPVGAVPRHVHLQAGAVVAGEGHDPDQPSIDYPSDRSEVLAPREPNPFVDPLVE